MSEQRRPSDPVIDFICDPHTARLVMDGSDRWPWSRLSRSRLEKIGYRLLCLRATQLGLTMPTRQEARAWAAEKGSSPGDAA